MGGAFLIHYIRSMRLLITSLLILFAMNIHAQSIYDLSFISIDGDTVDLSSYKGKKIVFVNVASECGFTPQYVELQGLHEAHGDEVQLIGFPCNQFGSQEPGSEDEIQAFCEKNYGVSFLMASKVDVKGDDQHPIYEWLTKKNLNNEDNSNVLWNFEKFIVNEEGELIEHFRSAVSPMLSLIHISSPRDGLLSRMPSSA